jgi:DNA-dependent RNA polymerase auxiliary subunit epsilon
MSTGASAPSTSTTKDTLPTSGFYSNFQTASSPNNTNELTTILKDPYTMTYSDYEKLKIAEQYNKLYLNSKRETEERNKLKVNKRIYNLSLAELVQNASLTYVNVMNDVILFLTKPAQDRDWNQFAQIFVNADNMIYMGLLLVVVAFALWVIDVTQ